MSEVRTISNKTAFMSRLKNVEKETSLESKEKGWPGFRLSAEFWQKLRSNQNFVERAE